MNEVSLLTHDIMLRVACDRKHVPVLGLLLRRELGSGEYLSRI